MPDWSVTPDWYEEQLFNSMRRATKAIYPEARIPETPMGFRDFTDEELATIKRWRHHEIRVTHDGRIEVSFSISPEAAAKSLHYLLRPKERE